MNYFLQGLIDAVGMLFSERWVMERNKRTYTGMPTPRQMSHRR